MINSIANPWLFWPPGGAYLIWRSKSFAPPNHKYNFKKSIPNIISQSSSVVERLAVTLKVVSSNPRQSKTFFYNWEKKTENMMMVAPSSGQSSHRLAMEGAMTSDLDFWWSCEVQSVNYHRKSLFKNKRFMLDEIV